MPVEQLRSQQRHQRILDAATRVFAAKGYHGTLVDEIALEAETSKGGVYFHFPNKQAIFLALLDRLADLLRERIDAAMSGEMAPLARAETALRVVLDTFASHRRLARLFMVEALGAGPEFNARMIQIRGSFADLIRAHLDDAVAQGAIPPLDTATAAAAWFGAVNEVVTHWALAERPGRLEEVYPTIRALLLRGIQADYAGEADDADQADALESSHKADWTDLGHQPDRVGLGHQPDRADLRHQPDQADLRHQSDRAGVGHQPDRAGMGHQPDRADLRHGANRADLGHQTDPAGLGRQADRVDGGHQHHLGDSRGRPEVSRADAG